MSQIYNKWDHRFLQLAEMVARWSKDPSTHVGAVIIRPDKTIASMGFNGFARGVSDTLDRLSTRNTRLMLTLHAELNAILSAREPLHGYSLYVWPFPPCAQCAAAIIQAGIKAVFCPQNIPERWQDSFRAANDSFAEAGVSVHFL
jgi:dCMP deaminase